MKQFIFLFVFNFFSINNGISCSCGTFPDFFKNTNIRDYSQNCIAVLDSLTYAYEYQGLIAQTGHFSLVDTINHVNSTIGQSILVIGQDGLNCGALVHNLTVGDTFLLALFDGYFGPFEKDTFYLDGCGTWYVNLTESQYQGWTTSSLKEKINQITTSTENIFKEQPIKIFPNPVVQKLFIESQRTPIERFKVYNQIGQLVVNLDGLKSKIEEVIVSQFPKGVYFLLITTSEGTVRRTFIKN